MASDQTSTRTLDISLVAIFGALIALSSLVPLSVVVGGTGFFSFTWVIQTLTGILLGPYKGGAAGLVGGLVGNLIGPSVFGPIGFVLPALATIQAGLIAWRRWRTATLILGSLILLWFLVLWFRVPDGLVAWPVSIFHILGVGILIAFGNRLPLMIREVRDTNAAFLGWGLTAYCADISRHMFGNILLVVVFAVDPVGFLPILPRTAIEQTMFAVASALIGVPTLLAVNSAKLDVPIIRWQRKKKIAKENKPG